MNQTANHPSALWIITLSDLVGTVQKKMKILAMTSFSWAVEEQTVCDYWLVGGLEHFFPNILGMSSSQLTFLFFRVVGSTTNQLICHEFVHFFKARNAWSDQFQIPHVLKREKTSDHRYSMVLEYLPHADIAMP